MGKRIAFNDIVNASHEYKINMEKEFPNDTFNTSDLEVAFRNGLLWFKDNIWHEPEEIPEERTTILFECNLLETQSFYTQNIIFKDDYEKYLVKHYDIKRWCYVNDLI